MKNTILISSLLLIAFESIAQASSVGYIGNDGYFYLDGLTPGSTKSIQLAGEAQIKAYQSNACGMIKIRSLQNGEKIEIEDNNSNTYQIVNNNFSNNEAPKCNGTVIEKNIFQSTSGNTVISGLTPNSPQKVKFFAGGRKQLKVNSCGFIRVKLFPNTKAVIVDGEAHVINSSGKSAAIACKNSQLYKAYPEPEVTYTTSESNWKQQNPVTNEGNPNAILISQNTSTASSPIYVSGSKLFVKAPTGVSSLKGKYDIGETIFLGSSSIKNGYAEYNLNALATYEDSPGIIEPYGNDTHDSALKRESTDFVNFFFEEDGNKSKTIRIQYNYNTKEIGNIDNLDCSGLNCQPR